MGVGVWRLALWLGIGSELEWRLGLGVELGDGSRLRLELGLELGLGAAAVTREQLKKDEQDTTGFGEIYERTHNRVHSNKPCWGGAAGRRERKRKAMVPRFHRAERPLRRKWCIGLT